jgi:hypothetical protein
MKKQIRILAAAAVLSVAPALHAQTTPVPSERNSGQNLVATKIAGNFTNLAGGDANAMTLVNALRAGTDATIVTVVPPPAGSPPGTLPTTTQTTVTVPTKPMGWGNVKHALALAQDQLARAGITNPTAAQLQTALNGGALTVTNADGTTTTTTVKGVLTMRADGMGWGNIAKEGGTKLGQVAKADMSAKGVKAPATTSTSTTGLTTAAGPSATTAKSTQGITTAAGGSPATTTDKSPKGVTTAAGASAAHGSKGLVTASGASAGASPQGPAYGRGIVTGAGGSATQIASANHGNKGSGAGVVTGGGNSAAASGITTAEGANSNAGGNGKGGGNGNAKGKGG